MELQGYSLCRHCIRKVTLCQVRLHESSEYHDQKNISLMKDQVLLNKADCSCADYVGAWLLLASGCLHKRCSPDCVTGILPMPAFVYGHPTQQLLQVWTFDSTIHFYTGQDICTPWCGNMKRPFFSRTDIILFPSFFQSELLKDNQVTNQLPISNETFTMPHMQPG